MCVLRACVPIDVPHGFKRTLSSCIAMRMQKLAASRLGRGDKLLHQVNTELSSAVSLLWPVFRLDSTAEAVRGKGRIPFLRSSPYVYGVEVKP